MQVVMPNCAFVSGRAEGDTPLNVDIGLHTFRHVAWFQT